MVLAGVRGKYGIRTDSDRPQWVDKIDPLAALSFGFQLTVLSALPGRHIIRLTRLANSRPVKRILTGIAARWRSDSGLVV